MNRMRSAVPTALLLAVLVAACTDATDPAPGPAMTAAKAPAAPSVQVTDPSYGYKGEAGKVVSITGSGFDAGSAASWERNGAADPKITVVSSQFVSSSQLKATINIAGDAALALYDVAVTTSKGRKGIGTELFEVTTAYVIPGGARAFGVNDNGQIAGVDNVGRPFVWSESSGLEVIGPTDFMGMDISRDGLTVTGSHNRSRDTDVAVLWSKSGASWVQSSLPTDPAGIASGVRAMASDLSSGAASHVAGWEALATPGGKRGSTYTAPRLWIRNGGGAWQRVVLPAGPGGLTGQAWDVAPNGSVVGASNGQAVAWDPNGTGGYTVTVLGPAGSRVEGINEAGTMAVGTNGSGGAFWARTSTSVPWVGPTAFPSNCGIGHAVDNTGRTVGFCTRSQGNAPAALLPPLPYTSSSILFLGGVGNKDVANPVNISPSGNWIVGLGGGTGSGSQGSSLKALYWRPF